MDNYSFIEYGRNSTINSSKDKTKSRDAFKKLKSWVRNKVVEVDKVVENSPLFMLNNAFDSIDDINDVEDEEFDNYMIDLNDFFNKIEEADLDNNKTRHEFQALLSPNLSKLFGITIKSLDVPQDWIAPSKHGLDNSSPIIKKYDNKNETNDDTKSTDYDSKPTENETNDDTKSTDYDSKPTEFKMNDYKGVEINEYRGVLNEHKEEKFSEISESETSSEYGDDSDIRVTNMSPELMKILNMDTTGMDFTTDWKPPDRPGLDNDKLKSLTGYTKYTSEAK